VRITGGTFRSRRIDAPAGDRTRPTTDRVREALFSVLAHEIDIDGATILDAFAGSGALAFEALSRGARFAYLLEESRAAARIIDANAAALGVAGRVSVVVGDAERGIARVRERVRLALADPPWAMIEGPTFARFLARAAAKVPWDENALFVVEHRAGDELPDVVGLETIADRTWGDTGVRISRVTTPPSGPSAP
jgi:16S rRNA (guanine966-N2)-methyltransferase